MDNSADKAIKAADRGYAVDDPRPAYNTRPDLLFAVIIRDVLRYATHWKDCSANEIACSCGLSQLKAKVKRVLSGEKE